MIKRTQFKCCFVATLVAISSAFCTLIAIVVYQSVVSYTGLNQAQTVVSDCPTTYLNLKVSAFSTKKLISFVFICLELLLTIICFILILVGFVKFRQNIIVGNTEKEGRNEENKTIFFSQKGLYILYVVFSLNLLCNTVYFGIMLAYVLQYAYCKFTLLTQPLVLAILSGISLLFYLISWIILMVVISKINNLLQHFEVARKKQKIYSMVEFTEMNMNEPEEEVKENTKKPLYGVQRRDFATYKPHETERTQQNKSQSDNAIKDETPKFVEDQYKKKAVRETVHRKEEKIYSRESAHKKQENLYSEERNQRQEMVYTREREDARRKQENMYSLEREDARRKAENMYSREREDAHQRQERISPRDRDYYIEEKPYFKSKRKSPFYEEEDDSYFQKRQKESNLMWTNKSRELVQSPRREEVEDHGRRKKKSKILLDIIRNKYAD